MLGVFVVPCRCDCPYSEKKKRELSYLFPPPPLPLVFYLLLHEELCDVVCLLLLLHLGSKLHVPAVSELQRRPLAAVVERHLVDICIVRALHVCMG